MNKNNSAENHTEPSQIHLGLFKVQETHKTICFASVGTGIYLGLG
jgi:hypothetical protein